MRLDKTLPRWESSDSESIQQAARDIGHALPTMTCQELGELRLALASAKASPLAYDVGFRAGILELLSAFYDTRYEEENEQGGLEAIQATPLLSAMMKKLLEEGPMSTIELRAYIPGSSLRGIYEGIQKFQEALLVEERYENFDPYQTVQALTLLGEKLARRLP